MVGRAGVVVALLALVLAGCSKPAPAVEQQDAAPNATPAPVVPVVVATPGPPAPTGFTAVDCDAIVWIQMEPFADVYRLLPLGFTPLDYGDLLKLQDLVGLGQGAIGVALATCAADEAGRPLAFGFVLAAVQPPELPDALPAAYLDLYAPAAYWSTAEQAPGNRLGWNATAGLDVRIGGLSQDVPNPLNVSRVPDVRLLNGNASLAGEAFILGTGTGGPRYHTSDPEGGPRTLRFWHDTPEGLVYADFRSSRHGTAGVAQCTYLNSDLQAWMGGRTNCDAEAQALMIPDVSLQATFTLIPDVHA